MFKGCKNQLVKMATLPKAIYRPNAFPIKVPMSSFKEIERETIRLYGTTKDPEQPKPS